MSKFLSKKKENEESVINAIVSWYSEHTYGPSYRNLQEITGIPLGTVYAVCKELRDDGVVTYDEGVARTIRVKGKHK